MTAQVKGARFDEDQIERIGRLTSAVKGIIAAFAALVAAVFAAGVYYAHIMSDINKYTSTIDDQSKQISILTTKLTENDQTITKLKADLNTQFGLLRLSIPNYQMAIQNTSSKNGAGYSPETGPGHCADGAMVVGIQPLASNGDGSGFRFQCGKLPELKVQ
jgi:hypothetical protein